MTRRDQIATAIIVVGIILIAVGGSKEATCYTLDEVIVSIWLWTCSSCRCLNRLWLTPCRHCIRNLNLLPTSLPC